MTWPAVFDGIGALVVNCALDPDVLADKIPGLTWVAVKVGGTDVAPDSETEHCLNVWLGRNLEALFWVYCDGPPEDDAALAASKWKVLRMGVIYDVEAAYKTDEGAPADYPTRLVAAHQAHFGPRVPAAVTSYGQIPGNNTFPSSIDFRPFVEAGWPMFAQAYDGFTVIDAESYTVRKGGPYPADGVHTLTRSLRLVQGQAVYRPESIDG